MELFSGFMNELILIVVSFFTSMLTAIIGMGGGILLISVMAIFLPPPAIVPLHGVVQLVSSGTRTLFGFRYVERRILGQYLCGAIIGAAVGSQFVTRIPAGLIPVMLGSFILIVTWAPIIKAEAHIPGRFLWLGSVHTVLTLFIGVTGPLLPSFLLRERLGKDGLVVNVAVMAMISHVLRVVTFGLLGFAFAPYVLLLGGMIISVTLGSYVGTFLRGKVPEKPFRQLLKILVTVLAILMISRVVLG
jgi:uncharacterized membrane protein YfcA